jgi:Protein of unknown function (DUF2892)
MTKNVGAADRVVRIVIGLGIAALIYVGTIGDFRAGDVAAIVAGIIAAYLILTGLFARCLVYKMGDIDTTIQEQPYSTTDDRSGL